MTVATPSRPGRPRALEVHEPEVVKKDVAEGVDDAARRVLDAPRDGGGIMHGLLRRSRCRRPLRTRRS